MNDFLLKKSGWQDIGNDPRAQGCILVVINASGHRYCFGTIDTNVPEIVGGDELHFIAAILNEPTHKETVDPFTRVSTIQEFDFDVMGEHFSIPELRKNGVILQDIDVDVYWHVVGRGMALEQAFHVLKGKLVNPSYDEEQDISSFSVVDARLSGELPFPPVVLKRGLISLSGDQVESLGKPYPIVIGSVNKLPILDIGSPGLTQFLALHDPLSELSGSPATALYDGDDGSTPGIGSQSFGTDAAGNRYLQVDTSGGTPTQGRDVTVDVTGHTPATVNEAIKYMLSFFGDEADIFDLSSLNRIKSKMSAITLGMAFNHRENSGVLGIIRDRLSKVLPFAMIQRGTKYAFEPISWDRDVTKILSFGKNLTRKIHGPIETSRSEIYNSFTVKYGLSGFRGDYRGCIVRDWSDSYSCLKSSKRYGKRAMPDVDAGDLADEESANWLIEWLIETFSKMRVKVGYEATLDAVNVRLFDNVRVIDEYENWDALFKVVGIERVTGPTIGLDLISMDDYTEVYGIPN